MQRTKSLQNSWEKLKKSNRLVTVKRQKMFFFLTKFDHFSCPAETDPYNNLYRFRQFNKLSNLSKAALAEKDAIMNLNNWEWGSQSFFRLKRARCADCFPEFQLNIGGRVFRLYSQIRSLGERLMRRSRRSNSKRWLFSAFEDSPRISLEAEASFCSEWSEFLHPHRNLFFCSLFEAPSHQFRLTETLMNGWSTIVESM